MLNALTLNGPTVAAPAAGPDFESALQARLAALPAVMTLAGARVVPGMVPERAPLPCVTYAVVARSEDADLDGDAGVTRARVQVSAWAHGYGEAKALVRGIRQGLPIGFRGPLGPGVTVRETYHSDGRDQYLPPDDGSDLGTYHVTFDLKLNYLES